jgi:hypothetical protein
LRLEKKTDANQRVGAELKDVLEMMKSAGFPIDQEVKVTVDENLPFMGYTSREWQTHSIVVSGFAAQSGIMLRGLLAHELSHVYRNITKHPSHNEQIIAHLAGSFINLYNLHADFQREILHQVINHIQDLYADDISMQVLITGESRLLDSKVLEGFFVEWVKDEPAQTSDARKNRWVNAAIMLNNSFAVSNMQRHGIGDHDQKAKLKNVAFLNRIRPEAAENFSYFNDFMVGLREEVTDAEFKDQMEDYLARFFELILRF